MPNNATRQNKDLHIFFVDTDATLNKKILAAHGTASSRKIRHSQLHRQNVLSALTQPGISCPDIIIWNVEGLTVHQADTCYKLWACTTGAQFVLVCPKPWLWQHLAGAYCVRMAAGLLLHPVQDTDIKTLFHFLAAKIQFDGNSTKLRATQAGKYAYLIDALVNSPQEVLPLCAGMAAGETEKNGRFFACLVELNGRQNSDDACVAALCEELKAQFAHWHILAHTTVKSMVCIAWQPSLEPFAQGGALRTKIEQWLAKKERQGVALRCAVGPPVATLREIAHSYNRAWQGMQWAHFAQTSPLLILPDKKPCNVQELCKQNNWGKRLARHIGGANPDNCKKLFVEILAALRGQPYCEIEEAQAFYLYLMRCAQHKKADVAQSLRLLPTPPCALIPQKYSQSLYTLHRYILCMVEENRFSGVEKADNTLAVKARIYIQNHFTDSSLCLKSISLALQVSTTCLTGAFRKECGTTVGAYITELRIEKSKQLLAGNMKLKEIALAVGFTSAGYYSRVFKKKEGIMPSFYQKSAAVQGLAEVPA